jgi:hypothetical protein
VACHAARGQKGRGEKGAEPFHTGSISKLQKQQAVGRRGQQAVRLQVRSL